MWGLMRQEDRLLAPDSQLLQPATIETPGEREE